MTDASNYKLTALAIRDVVYRRGDVFTDMGAGADSEIVKMGLQDGQVVLKLKNDSLILLDNQPTVAYLMPPVIERPDKTLVAPGG